MKSVVSGIPQTFFPHPILMFTAAVMLATLVLVMLPSHGSSQGKERAVKIETFKNQPVDIVEVKVKGAAIERDRKFSADSDWLNGMTVTIKNVSDEPVVYVTVSVGAHYEKDGVRKRTNDGRDYVATIDLGYGVRPHLPGEPPRSHSAVPLMPGQTADLMFSEIQRDELYWLLRDYSTDIPELKLGVDHVAWYGKDDKMWIRGRMHRLDPNDPRHWMPVDDPDPPLIRRNHAARKPGSELARMLGLNLAARYTYLPDPLPTCTYRDGGEDIKHCTAVDTRGITCDYEDQRLFTSGTKDSIAGDTTPRVCHGIDPNVAACASYEEHPDTRANHNCTPPQEGGDCVDYICPARFCPNGLDDCTCQCFPPSPILIDTMGNGFDLTDAARGVMFDLNADGTREELSWTSADF